MKIACSLLSLGMLWAANNMHTNLPHNKANNSGTFWTELSSWSQWFPCFPSSTCQFFSSGWLSEMAARSNQKCTLHPMHPHRERASLPLIIEKRILTFIPISHLSINHWDQGNACTDWLRFPKAITVIWGQNHYNSGGEDEVSMGEGIDSPNKNSEYG